MKRGLVAAVLAVVIIGLAAARSATAGSDGARPNRVENAIESQFKPIACASIELDALKASDFRGRKRLEPFLAGLAARASERINIICNYLGPSTIYLRFASHAVLRMALHAAPPQPAHQLCVLNHELFVKDGMNFAAAPGRHPFQDACAELHGQIEPALRS